MNELSNALTCRIQLLKRAIKQAEKDGEFPEGRLRVSKTAGRVRYYEVTEKNDTKGKYLSKKEQLSRVKQLAQKDYNKQFLKTVKIELNMLEGLLLKYNKNQAEESYNNLSIERKQLVTSYIQPDNLYAKEWQSKIFKSNPYKPEKKIFDTKRGEKVRSKSEAIIADMLYDMRIPYRYEYPVRIYNGKIKYPDFTLLKIKTREVIYFEHFGRMDEEGYRIDTMEKMDEYRTSGIYPGKNLIFTYETDAKPLDIKGTRRMLADIFM